MQQINNLLARTEKHHMQIKKAIDRVIASGWLVLGEEVKRFEESFAAYVGVSDCISLGNGTDAIELALRAMGVGRGDVVAMVANAGMYTTTAVLAIGAKPYFMDVGFETRVVTLLEVIRAVEAGAKAVVVTHLYGLAIPEIFLIAKYCREKGVFLLEDCAQAHGAKINNQSVGTFGDAASFSFYPTKNLGALGDGGAVVTNNSTIAQNIKCLRQYGWSEKYTVTMLGARNSRLDEIQAAILFEFLPTLDADNNRRREIAARYSSSIQHSEVSVPKLGGVEYVAHLYTICTSQRQALREHLYKLKVASDVHYPIPDYRQPVFAEHFADVHLKITERLSNEILTLPCYPEMSDTEVDNVIKAVNSWQ